MILSRYPINDQAGDKEETFLDAATHDKIRRHIADKNDIISEEDIRNIRTDIYNISSKTSEVDVEPANGEEEKMSDTEKSESHENEDPITTPWDVLKS